MSKRIKWASLTSASPKYVFSPVGSDHSFIQFGDDDVLTTQELKHTLVSPPVLRFDWWSIQININLEGAIIVWEDISFFHTIMNLISIFSPEHHGSVRKETCSVAADWRGGGFLEERYWGKNWTEGWWERERLRMDERSKVNKAEKERKQGKKIK